MGWQAKARRRAAKRDERANLFPIHGSSLRTQPPRPLSLTVKAKLRKRGDGADARRGGTARTRPKGR